jgi:hypothetical protein
MISINNIDFNMSMNKLPLNIVEIIYDYIPKKYLVFTNKNNYKKYHSLLKSSINFYENYIRKIVRKDFDFIFETIIDENSCVWKKLKQYQYENNVYENYIYFILDYSIANESTKCKKIIKKFMNKKIDNIGLNESKKYVSKYTNGKIKHK